MSIDFKFKQDKTQTSKTFKSATKNKMESIYYT